MAEDSTTGLSRRKFIVASGAAGTAAMAGCTGGSGGGQGDNASTGSDGSSADEPLTADGSSTVYPITSNGASVWNSNPPAGDEDYWPPSAYGIDTDMPMASYFGSAYGFSGSEGEPPFLVNVGLSHSGTGIEKLMNDQVDIGDSSAPVADELPDADQSTLDNFVDHVVGVDGQPIMVSQSIADAGVNMITGQELRGIYSGDIQQWSEIGAYSGPEKEIQAICRAEGSGTDTSFRSNLYGDAEAEIPGCDARIGQNQQVRTTVINSDNAIAYAALAFVGGQAPAISLELDGTTYTPGENLGESGYPLARDLHAYTWQDTSEKEAAFLRMILSPYGQENFVATNDYFMLPDSRVQEELDKLPDPTGDAPLGSANSSNSTNSS
jgi:phosphate transport system substrate-binding protein